MILDAGVTKSVDKWTTWVISFPNMPMDSVSLERYFPISELSLRDWLTFPGPQRGEWTVFLYQAPPAQPWQCFLYYLIYSGVHVEVRGQLAAVASLFRPRGCQGWELSCEAWGSINSVHIPYYQGVRGIQPSFKVKKWKEAHERDDGLAGKDLKVKNNCSKSSGYAAFGIRIKCFLCQKQKDALTKLLRPYLLLTNWK